MSNRDLKGFVVYRKALEVFDDVVNDMDENIIKGVLASGTCGGPATSFTRHLPLATRHFATNYWRSVDQLCVGTEFFDRTVNI